MGLKSEIEVRQFLTRSTPLPTLSPNCINGQFVAGPTTYGKVEANCLHFESGGEICTFQGGHKVACATHLVHDFRVSVN